MIKVGLTGNLCSGHMKVSEILETFDVPIFDADICLKFLLNFREDIIRDIKIQLGSEVYNGNNIDQNKFNTSDKFNRLIDIAEPEMLKLYESWRLVQRDYSYTVFKYSILFERKLEKKMDYVISTFKPRPDRLSSISTELGLKLSDAQDIINSEMDDLYKNQNATWTIHNYDNLSLLTQAKKIHDNIEAKSIKNILNKTNFNTSKNLIF